MKQVPVLLVLCVLLFLQLPLRSQEVFDSKPFACADGKEWHSLTWESKGVQIVRKGQLWLGMSGQSVADFGFVVELERNKTFLFRGNWDHYAEPVGINGQLVTMDFAPDYILLLPGDKLTLYYFCQQFTDDARGHILVDLWGFP